MSPNKLNKLVVEGSGFLAGQTILAKALFFIRTIVLARLLSPQDFGIISLSIVLIQGLGSITSIGMEKIIIQKKNLNQELIGNAWTINILRGLILTILTFALSPIYGSIINEPQTIIVLKIIAFIPFLEGLINPISFLAEREIQFRRISYYETLSTFLEVVSVIFLAIILLDVRALAIGMVLGNVLKVALSYLFFKASIFPRFNKKYLFELLSVAKHFIIISVGSVLMIQGDKLIIGSILGSQLLGYYVIAYQLAVFPIGILRKIVNRVTFPLFSKLQDDQIQLKTNVSKILQIQLALIIPFIIGIIFYADFVIHFLYGEKWTYSVELLKVLMIVTFGRGITIIAVPYIMGTGKFLLASKIKIIETSMFLIGVFLGTKYFGIIGAAYGAGLGYIIAGLIRLLYLAKKNNISIEKLFSYIYLPAITSIVGAIIGLWICGIFVWSGNIKNITNLSAFIIFYVFLSFFFQKELVILLKKIFPIRFHCKTRVG